MTRSAEIPILREEAAGLNRNHDWAVGVTHLHTLLLIGALTYIAGTNGHPPSPELVGSWVVLSGVGTGAGYIDMTRLENRKRQVLETLHRVGLEGPAQTVARVAGQLDPADRILMGAALKEIYDITQVVGGDPPDPWASAFDVAIEHVSGRSQSREITRESS